MLVFQCPFCYTPFKMKACTQEYATATDARRHLNKAHREQTVDVELLVKTKM